MDHGKQKGQTDNKLQEEQSEKNLISEEKKTKYENKCPEVIHS